MNINDFVAQYIQAKAEQAAAEKRARDAKKRAETAAAEILRHADGRPYFETESYSVAIERITRVILDTDKLFRDFKDIKDLDQYGKESTRDAITATARQAVQKTA